MPIEKPSSDSTNGTPPVASPLESVNNGPKHEAPARRPTPPSDGGLDAYLQVLGAHILLFNSWGIINTFGVYQEYYRITILSGESVSAISWIGTIQSFLLFLIGTLTGPIFDRGHFRRLIFIGTYLIVAGMMMTSLATYYYEIFLAQGVVVGLGAGCLFVPSVAIVATHFTSKRALMTGITAAGGSIGGIIFPIVFRTLQPRIGFGWATRVIAFIALGMLIVPLSIMRLRAPPPSTPRPLLNLKAFREAPFSIFSLGLFLAFLGLYFPFFYAPIYSSVNTGMGDDVAFYLLPVMNAGSIFGRIIPGLVADRVGSLNTIIPCAGACVMLAYGWLGIFEAAPMWILSVLYGFFSGAIVSLSPTIVAEMSPDMSLVGTRMGMSFTFAGLGLLIGNPIAAAIPDISQGTFGVAQGFSAGTILGGFLAFAALRALFVKPKIGWKI